MNSTTALQTELTRWANDLADLENECTADGWTDPEKLLLTLQRTSGTYRRRVLPRLEADRVLRATQAPAALVAYNRIITDELVELIRRLDELRLELIRFGPTAQLQLDATEILAGLRVLGRVILRFSQEVELPSLTARL